MGSAQSSDDPPREWHVILSGERRGPYTRPALYDVLDMHPAGWASPVWRPGMLDWRPAKEVRALLQDAQTSAHGVPAAIFLDEPSEPVLATQPIAAHVRARMMAQTTQDMPAYRAPEARSTWRRSLLAAVFGSAVAICGILLLRIKLTQETKRTAPTSSAAWSARSATVPRAREARAENEAALGDGRAEERVAPSAAPLTEVPASKPPQDRPRRASDVKSVRVRARWAPVRADGDPAAKVLCSLPRGAQVAVFAERPGTHARWFEVRCDADTPGWVHENFLARVHEAR